MSKIIVLLFFSLCCLVNAWAIDIGTSVPSCKARLLKNNDLLDLQAYHGKVVYLDFWATWCPPCKKSMPFLNALHNDFQDKGFEVIGISVDENPDDIDPFLAEFPVDFVLAREPSGECPKKYAVIAMPSSYLIDRNGLLRAVHLGFRDTDQAEIRRQVVELLEEKK